MLRSMSRSNFIQIAAVFLLLALSALSAGATAPRHINNVCAVFEQNDGWFTDWQSAAKLAEAERGIPVPVLMATMRKESGFKGNAKPPRTKLLGFIPWTRVSTAYGYSQALDGTWSQYKRETGRSGARRSDFADAVDFVGWYHAKTSALFGIPSDDAYNLYLAYYFGWTAYERGDWKENVELQRYAQETADMAQNYAAQLRGCD
jgi:hypothetical protein